MAPPAATIALCHLTNINPNNKTKSPNNENACANIPCNFRDRDISRLGVAYLIHVIDRSLPRL